MAEPTLFTVQWDPAVVEHVLARVAAYPFPIAPEGGGWMYGTDADYLKALTAHWTETYDWRAAEAELNRFPQFNAPIDGFDIHYVHVVGEARGKRPLIITHGWPGSHYEFWQAIEPLAYPSRHGGDPADAFDLVIPSLPGFGFSSKPARPFGQRATARLFDKLMREALGYDTYLAQGGDWGSLVTSFLGLDHAAHCRGIHLNMVPFQSPGGPQTDEERERAAKGERAMAEMGGYFRLQASKPQSIAWAMADNPVGQASWIIERFHDWSDLRAKPFEQVYSYDQLLTNVMIYVMTGSFTTGAWYYRALFEEQMASGPPLGPGQRCETPTGVANFPGEALYQTPPRGLVERAYNVVHWTDMDRGGHFAAMEEPGLFVDDLRAWGRQAAV